MSFSFPLLLFVLLPYRPYHATHTSGGVNRWGIDVLVAAGHSAVLVLFSPTVFSTISFTAFLYGNGLSCLMAIRLVRACHFGATDGMIRHIKYLYAAWNSSPDVRHHTIYWNMRHKRIVWLNGSHSPQLEFLITPSGNNDDTIIGFGITQRDWMMRRRMSYLRRTVHH